MAIGHKVAAEVEAREERELNEQGKLSGRQLKQLVAKGLSLSDARELAASGVRFEDIAEIAEIQAQAAASQPSEMAQLVMQNREFMEQVIQKARNRRPESYNGDFPEPLDNWRNLEGTPMPSLACKTWEGIWVEEKRKAQEGYEQEEGQLTRVEIRLLNALPEGLFVIENRDGEKGQVRVIADHDPASGAVLKRVIAFPAPWYSMEHRHKKPAITDYCRQILNIEGNVNAWLDAHEKVAVVA